VLDSRSRRHRLTISGTNFNPMRANNDNFRGWWYDGTSGDAEAGDTLHFGVQCGTEFSTFSAVSCFNPFSIKNVFEWLTSHRLQLYKFLHRRQKSYKAVILKGFSLLYFGGCVLVVVECVETAEDVLGFCG